MILSDLVYYKESCHSVSNFFPSEEIAEERSQAKLIITPVNKALLQTNCNVFFKTKRIKTGDLVLLPREILEGGRVKQQRLLNKREISFILAISKI